MIKRPSDLWPEPLMSEMRRLARLGVDPVKVVGDEDNFSASPAVSSPYFEYCTSGQDFLSLLVAVSWLRCGPKIANVTEEQWQALSRVEVRLEVKDFRLPYPCLLINMPPGKMHEYVILHEREVLDRAGSPIPVLIGTSVSRNHQHDIVNAIRQREGRDVEASLSLHNDDVSDEEAESALSSFRVACNLALAMTNYGYQSEYLFPKEVEREQKYVRKGNRPSRDGVRPSDRLADQPLLVTLDRRVKLSRREGGATDNSGSVGGREMPFHWRRGHWHRVPCGKGRAERKLVLYPPVMVRADLLNADVMDTTTTYQ